MITFPCNEVIIYRENNNVHTVRMFFNSCQMYFLKTLVFGFQQLQEKHSIKHNRLSSDKFEVFQV